MRRFAITLLSNCVALAVATALIQSFSYHHQLRTLVLAGLILGIVNFALRPLVILMTLPAVILSLGVGLLFVNAAMLWVTSKLVTGFRVGGFSSTVEGALVIWLVNLALRPWAGQLRKRDRRARRKKQRAIR